MNCSEQVSVAQRRTAALLLHARCRDVAPKDLPSARFATLEPQKLFMRMSPGNGCFKKAPHRTRGKVRRWSVGHQRRTRPPVQMARPGPSPITVPSFGAGRGDYSFANDVDMAPRFWELIAQFPACGYWFSPCVGSRRPALRLAFPTYTNSH